MSLPVQQKRALITGGSRGIGAAIVKRLACEGAHVALTYVSQPDRANETVQAAQAFGVQALAIQAELLWVPTWKTRTGEDRPFPIILGKVFQSCG